MAVQTTNNKPINPRGNDQSPKGYNRAALYSGKALDFDGVNDFATIDYSDTLGSVWTWSSIIEFDAISGYQVIFGGSNSSSNITIYLKDNQINFYTDGDNLNTAFDFETGEKYHIACSQSGDTISIYVNGQAAGSVSLTATLNSTSNTYTLCKNPASSYQFLNAKISGVKLFSTALTAAQVADLYNNPEKIVPTGVADSALKLWLPMMEGAGTTAYDGSGNGNHGTISGATYVNGVGAPVAQSAVIDWNKGINSFTYSEDFSNANWITIDVTKVSTSEPDYIGGNTAANITWLAGSPRYFYQNIGVSGASTLSFYVKSNGGGNKFRLFGNGTLAMGSDMTATSEWVRYDFEFTGNASQGIGITQASDNSAADLLVCFAQVETNASVGPYVRTGATAQPTPVLLPQGLTSGRDITGVNLFENVRKQGALNLDGNSWAEVHDNASVDLTTAISMECWAYIDDLVSTRVFFAKWAADTAQRAYVLYQSGDDLALTLSDGSNYGTSSTNVLTTGWHHIVATYVQNGNMTYYVDGSQTDAFAFTRAIRTTTAEIEIGRNEGPTGANYFKNQIAQPRIYNRALTAEEVQRNYDAGKNIYK